MNRQNHYATLHVDPCASAAEIKSAFRILAQRYHPDVTKDQDGERKFKDVAEAYRTLRRPDSKVAYDHQINNFCAYTAATSDPDIDSFNWGLAMLQIYSWVWLSSIRAGE